MEYKAWNIALKKESPYHSSSQNLILLPSLTSNLVLAWIYIYCFLLVFHNLTLYHSLPSWEHHPPIFSPNLADITCLHDLSLSTTNLKHHVPRKDLLSIDIFLIPNPTLLLSKQTIDQLTKWSFFTKMLNPNPPKGGV